MGGAHGFFWIKPCFDFCGFRSGSGHGHRGLALERLLSIVWYRCSMSKYRNMIYVYIYICKNPMKIKTMKLVRRRKRQLLKWLSRFLVTPTLLKELHQISTGSTTFEERFGYIFRNFTLSSLGTLFCHSANGLLCSTSCKRFLRDILLTLQLVL